MKESVATTALLESALQDDRASMEKFIADLVRLPSENPPGNYYRECRDFVAEQFRQCGLEPVIHTLQTPGHEPL
jgi:acetylornithine deacetylase/succinyl-diaminopimelate desuccinylase-like protein